MVEGAHLSYTVASQVFPTWPCAKCGQKVQGS